MKTEVYSWRVSPDVKASLQREARRRNMSLAGVLDLAAREWLNKSSSHKDDVQEQKRLREAMAPFLGSIKGTDPHRSANVSKEMRRAMRERYGR